MDSQKGSLKDRLRSWFLFLKYKLNLKKKKKEEKKRKKLREKELKKNAQISATGKYYSKPKIFALTLAGLFLGIFESKADKERKVLLVEEKIALLKINAKELTLEQYNSLSVDIKKEITKLKMSNRFDNKIKSKLDVCESKMKEIVKKKNDETVDNCKNIDQNDQKVREVYIPTLEIKVINKELKEYEKKLKELDNKIKSSEEYNHLYGLEFSLKQLKLRFRELLNQYNNLKELPGFSKLENIFNIETIDIYDLRQDSEKIEIQLKKCDSYLNSIQEIRKSILDKNKEKKIEKNKVVVEDKKTKEKKEEKKEKKKKEEKKVDDKILEIKLANRIVLDKLSNEKRNVEKIKRNMGKLSVQKRKKSIFYYTKNMLSSIFNFSLSIFPLSIFKNKFIGGLTSGIMINNSLRSVKNLLMPEMDTVYFLYSDFEEELNEAKDYLNSIAYVCNDSINQINDIRNTIYAQYGNEVEYSSLLSNYLKDLDGIEAQVLRHQATILGLQEQVYVTSENNKQKIKQWTK